MRYGSKTNSVGDTQCSLVAVASNRQKTTNIKKDENM
jgi:hypothetical protein